MPRPIGRRKSPTPSGSPRFAPDFRRKPAPPPSSWPRATPSWQSARTPHGEIDIVAKRRNLIAFVEVKARASLDEAAFAVTPRQQARIIDAAQGWLVAHPEHADFELRFDVILIAPRHLLRHVLAAFDASS